MNVFRHLGCAAPPIAYGIVVNNGAALQGISIDLAESGYVVNIIDPDVNPDDVTYKYQQTTGMVATDGKDFSLDINEFGLRSQTQGLAFYRHRRRIAAN